MRALVQRVPEASVEVDGAVVGQTGPGLLVLVCAMAGDDEDGADRLALRVAKLRIFRDDGGRMNRSLLDMGGGALVVSQFTLAADASSGNRPSFTRAAAPDEGRRLYERFVAQARGAHPVVETGVFAADMQVHLVNDGPVTIPLQMN